MSFYYAERRIKAVLYWFSRLPRAARRLYVIAMCDHRNMQRSVVFDSETEITVCKHCGSVTQFNICESTFGRYTKVA